MSSHSVPVNIHVQHWGVPILGPISYENGEPGVPKILRNGDPGPHFPMKMGTQGPQFGGSPFSHDTVPEWPGQFQNLALCPGYVPIAQKWV